MPKKFSVVFGLLLFAFCFSNPALALSPVISLDAPICASGVITVIVHYSFPDDNGRLYVEIGTQSVRPLDTFISKGSSGSWPLTFDTNNWPDGTTTITASGSYINISGSLVSVWQDIVTTNTPQIAIASPIDSVSGVVEFNLPYKFSSSNAAYGILKIYSDNSPLPIGSAHIELNPASASEGTWQFNYDTTYWQDGNHLLKASAYIPHHPNLATDTQNIETNNSPLIILTTPSEPLRGVAEFNLSYTFPSSTATYGLLWVYRDNHPVAQTKQITLNPTSSIMGSWQFSYDTSIWVDGPHTLRITARIGNCFGCDIRPPSTTQEVSFIVNNSPLPSQTTVSKLKQVAHSKVVTVAEPINVASGNMFISQHDIFIPAQEIPLRLYRTYNSQDDFDGMFGYGWRSNFDITLTEQFDGAVIEVDEKGVYTIYTRNSDGAYTPSAGKYSQLSKDADGTYVLLREHGRRLFFNAQGKLTKIEERNGNHLDIIYNSSGIITEVCGPSGRKFIFTSNSQGKITQVKDPVGRVFKYEYDSQNNLIRTTDPLANSTVYQYDHNHNLIQQADANGHRLYFEYDADDRAFHSWQENSNNEVTLFFDYANKTTTSSDSLGNITTYEYNEYGLVTKIIDALGNIHCFSWDADLNKISSTDAAGNTTYFTYDEKGNLLTIEDPQNNITTFTYEPNFNLLSSLTDALGNTTIYIYNEKGNLIKVKGAFNNTTTYNYDAFGNLVSLTDARANQTSYQYNEYGDLVKVTDPLDSQTLFSYDLLGNCIQITNAKASSTKFVYDKLNRLIQIIYPNNSQINYAYDAVGRRICLIDPRGNTTRYAYDEVNRLIQVTDALGNTTKYIYDTEGNRICLIDANGNKTEYLYDSLNRLTKVITALGNQTLFSYDAVGNLTSRTDSNNNTINYSYDSLNRLTQISYPDNGSVAFAYDAAGRCISMNDTQGSSTYVYDKLNRLIKVDGPGDDDTVLYEYDAMGNCIKMTNHNGDTTTYVYDCLNRLICLSDSLGNITTYAYDTLSNLTQINYPNHTQAVYSYDSLNRLINLSNIRLPTQIISSYTYDYDPSGMKTKLTLANGDYIEYTYDHLNRLISETKQKKYPSHKTYYSYAYEFDGVGNRLSLIREFHQKPLFAQESKDKTKDKQKKQKTKPTFWDKPGLTKFTYIYDKENRLLQLKAERVDTTYLIDYEYDSNGNLITKKEYKQNHSSKAKITQFTYDYQNRLTSISYPNGSTSRYAYDGLGRRIRSEEDNQIIKYLYDGLNVIIERDYYNATLATYTRGLSFGGGIGSVICQKVPLKGNTYYHYNDLGSVTSLSDAFGNLKQQYSYDAYGNLLSSKRSKRYKRQPLRNPYQFSTKEYGFKSGLYYFGARYYEPRVGRWLSPDPLEMVEGTNRYLYVHNNPVNALDPFGLLTVIIHGIGGGHEQGYSANLGNTLKAKGETVIEYTWSGGFLDVGSVIANFSSELKRTRDIANVRNEKLNVISHSMGTYISYEAIKFTGIRVDSFVTMGSFLGYRRKLSNVNRWINYWSTKDFISWPSVTSDAEQIKISTGHTGYWNDSAVVATVTAQIVNDERIPGKKK
jgi:RHS repeat-associated protein